MYREQIKHVLPSQRLLEKCAYVRQPLHHNTFCYSRRGVLATLEFDIQQFLPSLLPLPLLTKVLPTLIGLVGGEAAVGEVSCGAAFDMRMSLGGWTGLKSATVLVTGKVFPTVGTFGTGTESSCRRVWTCGFLS